MPSALALLLLAGCGGGAPPLDAGPDGSPLDASVSVDLHAMPPDAAPDLVVSNGWTSRIANLGSDGPALLDICIKDPGMTTVYDQPLLKSLGLPPVPYGAVSAPFHLPNINRTWDIQPIDGSQGDCTSKAYLEFTNAPFFDGKGFSYNANNTGGAISHIFVDTSVGGPTAGKQTLMSLPTNPGFNITWETGGTPLLVFPDVVKQVDPADGMMHSVSDHPPSDVSRMFTARAGGVATMFGLLEKGLVICDDLAAPVNGLSVCN